MDFSKFFIDRPIFAAGLIAIPILPISEYPKVVPPAVIVRAIYPGANPKVIAETVSTPLEEQINGVENMMYMKSVAGSDGVLQMTVTFRPGTDPDAAQVQVQNRVSQALSRLPSDVVSLGAVSYTHLDVYKRQRKSFTCASNGNSPTSSRKMVPPSANSKRPIRLASAPVKEPFSWPNNSLSTRLAGIAPQLTRTSGLALRGLRSCTARAMSSFPVPVSPKSKTVESVGATCSTFLSTVFIAWLSPMISPK